MTDDGNLIRRAARNLGLPEHAVRATAGLLSRGDTIPFIARYRKEVTGSLDETQIRAIEQEIGRLGQLDERREAIKTSISEQGHLTDELRKRIEDASSLSELEDIYLPYRPKRHTRATVARERGLEPLAKIIMSGRASGNIIALAQKYTGKDVAAAEDAIAGARDIIAEWLSESPRARNAVRNRMRREAVISSALTKDHPDESGKYRIYTTYSHPLRNIASHNYLALRRGESEGVLKISIKIDDTRLVDELCSWFVPRAASTEVTTIIRDAAADGYKRLLRPSIENEMAAEWKENADRKAISLFSDNLRQLLLAAPLRGRRIAAIDPGYRTGCKVVALDEHGVLLDDCVIYPNEPRRDTIGAMHALMDLIERHNLDAIALGDRTASRETEAFLKSSGIADFAEVYVVSENGASVYSASDVAREEFPDKDVTVRGAVSIGRRLIDPLAELVKIDPKSIGVGQYQHDVDQGALRESLDFTVMSCVNLVGVDLNTASPQLLGYISGIGPTMARRIVEFRNLNGAFATRNDLMKVPRLGSKIFEQAAGFLRVPRSKNPLDNTGIHPESYHIAEQIALECHTDIGTLIGNAELIGKIDPTKYSSMGEETVKDILAELLKPGRDPRTEAENVSFDSQIKTIDDLKADMILHGKVNNITAFGAFVDIGIKENGLLHISQMGKRRINNPADVVKIGQIIKVRIIDIDLDRGRISLSLKDTD